MYMAEVRRQDRQAPLGILTRPVPTQQGLDRESMSKIMQAGAVAVFLSAQPDLARQVVESSPNVSAVELVASAGDEEGLPHGRPDAWPGARGTGPGPRE